MIFYFFIIGIFILLILRISITSYPKIPSQNYTKKEFLKNVTNGSLLFFSRNSKNEKCIKWWMNCPFSHVAMVFTENDIVYILEADAGQGYRYGPRIIPLETKLKKYKGDTIVGYRQYIGPFIHPSRITHHAAKYMSTTLDVYMYAYWTSWCKRYDRMFCSELLMNILKELGMVHSRNERSEQHQRRRRRCECFRYTPGDFYHLTIPLNFKKYGYSSLKFFER